MELLTFKSDWQQYTFYLDENGKKVLHGEYKRFRSNGQLWRISCWCHGKWHGEYKVWGINGEIHYHCFYINGISHPYFEMDDQEKLLFQIQHPGFKFLDDV